MNQQYHKPADIKVLDECSHVLLRPTMYVGSTEIEIAKLWIFDEGKIVQKEIRYIPALVKLVDEVISNSIDEGFKTDFKYSNKISIDLTDTKITVQDNGRGLPADIDAGTGEYKSVLAFTRLKAGSNFNDEDKQTSIGRFGVGVSLVNIFSKRFEVKSINTHHKYTHLVCENNNKDITNKKVKEVASNNFGTEIIYEPDLTYFFKDLRPDYEVLDNVRKLIEKRIYDLSMIFPEITFKLNGKKVNASKFKEYCKLINGHFILHEDGYKLAICPAPDDFTYLSFVNGVDTLRGGTHVDLVMNLIQNALKELIKKKYKIEVKPSDIKSRLCCILSVRGLNNLKFDSQTKEKLVNPFADLAETLKNIPDKFYKNIMDTPEIIDPIVEAYLLKEKLREKLDVKNKQKQIQRKKIPKLIEANSSERSKCILFLAEGDSASNRFVEVRNINSQAMLPLTGKILNIYDCTDKEVLENNVIQNIISVIGLDIHRPEDLNNLRYSEIVILTDADVDGHSISALLINLFYKYWPKMFAKGMIKKYLSPIVIAKKGKDIRRFYDLEEYTEKSKNLDSGWNLTYNKGLGGLDKNEYSIMINEPIAYTFREDDATRSKLEVIFGSDSNKRKDWLQE